MCQEKKKYYRKKNAKEKEQNKDKINSHRHKKIMPKVREKNKKRVP
jgi:hypothetical protein